jgi:hypothetical protein
VELAESPYRKQFRQGATIVPRSFWFVDVKRSEMGFNQDLPALVSSERAKKEAKPAYKGCVIEGSVESRFLYATLLPVDMVPFGYLRLRLIVLPVSRIGSGYHIYKPDEAREKGYVHLAQWLERVEEEWRARGGPKAKSTTSLQWLDYRRKLSLQAPASFRVIYATSGTHVCACVLAQSQLHRSDEQGIHPQGFACDCTTFYSCLGSPPEASFLAAVLNAPAVDKAIKASQARGLWGARHVHKKVLDLPIPKFDAESNAHRRLAEIGETCAKRVNEWIAAGGPGQTRSIGLLRSRVRQMLKDELAEIDSIVKPMLGI